LMLVIDNLTSSFEWLVLDAVDNIMAEGDVRPRS